MAQGVTFIPFLIFTFIAYSDKVIGKFEGELNMPWLSFAPMILMWIMELTLFVLVVIVLVELKKLEVQKFCSKVKATKTNEQTSPKNDSL